jgi:hypothetical protein
MREFRILILVLLIALTALTACSQNTSSPINAKLIPWPDHRLSLESVGGAVVFGNPDQDVIVILDQAVRSRTRDVRVTAVEMSSGYLIETVDPLDRFLPTLNVAHKGSGPVVEVITPQIDKSEQWSTRMLQDLEPASITKTSLGTTTISELPNFISPYLDTEGINILFPEYAPIIDGSLFEVYETAGNLTFLLAPTSGSSAGVMSPVQNYGTSWITISTDMQTLQTFGLPSMLP